MIFTPGAPHSHPRRTPPPASHVGDNDWKRLLQGKGGDDHLCKPSRSWVAGLHPTRPVRPGKGGWSPAGRAASRPASENSYWQLCETWIAWPRLREGNIFSRYNHWKRTSTTLRFIKTLIIMRINRKNIQLGGEWGEGGRWVSVCCLLVCCWGFFFFLNKPQIAVWFCTALGHYKTFCTEHRARFSFSLLLFIFLNYANLLPTQPYFKLK